MNRSIKRRRVKDSTADCPRTGAQEEGEGQYSRLPQPRRKVKDSTAGCPTMGAQEEGEGQYSRLPHDGSPVLMFAVPCVCVMFGHCPMSLDFSPTLPLLEGML